ncbi:phosphotransferase enzyme family protein [Microlunatus soli]|uniref:Ser/Thr protein kinase RdoA involved in Cpx stress response, MazF antagonist n=1 Tax=Microlunatus soli TaxID=630515 RepID=A0A1H1YTN4_9ACTN|nr:aminoglycoside phosphotransferase family protein [Microlunatus soli]SDT24763.1 Ser/Thr protein kinase RdoA involved in Cpx stress response, MazF antagonist [Microlunatus soli]
MITDPLPAGEFVAELFGWSSPLAMTLAGEGHMGRIWHLETGAGSYAVKELHWARDVAKEEAAVTRQVAFCDAARAAGVRAPGSLRTVDGRYVTALPIEHGGRLVRAYEWVDARPLDESDRAVSAWVGETTAIIEGLAHPVGDQDLDAWFTTPPSADHWSDLVERCDAAGQPWAGMLRDVVPGLLALADRLEMPADEDLIIAHTDFTRQNVLVEPDGRFVLLDWDDACPATPSRTLGQVINNWHIGRSVVDLEGLRQTMRGYRDAGGTAEIRTVADLGDSICAFLNHLASQANLSLDREQPAAHTEGASRRMPGLLQHPTLDIYAEAVRAAAAL